MSAQITIQRLKEENAVLTVLAKRAAGEKLTAEDRQLMAELQKSRALHERLSESLDLEGAIRKTLRSPKGLRNANPDTTKLVKDAIFSDSIEKTVGKNGRDEELNKRREKVRDDMKGSGMPRRTTL